MKWGPRSFGGAQAWGEKVRENCRRFAKAAFPFRLEFPGVVTLGFKESYGCEEGWVGSEKTLVPRIPFRMEYIMTLASLLLF